MNKCLSLKTFSRVRRDWKTSTFTLSPGICLDQIPQACQDFLVSSFIPYPLFIPMCSQTAATATLKSGKPLSPLSAHFGLIRRLGWLYVLEVQHPGHERGNGTSVLWTKLPRLALSSPITNAHFERTIRGWGGRVRERERTLSIM